MQGNSRLYCLPEEALCHPETSAFYLKLRRRNGSVFQIYSLSAAHQRKGDGIGAEGGFWDPPCSAGPCWEGPVARWVGKSRFC